MLKNKLTAELAEQHKQQSKSLRNIYAEDRKAKDTDLNIQACNLINDLKETQPIIFEEVYVKDSDGEFIKHLQGQNEVFLESSLVD